MRIADLEPQDMKRVERWHESSDFDYKLPSLFLTDDQGNVISNPLFPIRRRGIQDGQIIGALAAKVEAEVYLWLNPEWGTPDSRLAAVEMFHKDVVAKARTIGFSQLYCVLPPEISRSFGQRLKDLGWDEARPWPKYVFELRP